MNIFLGLAAGFISLLFFQHSSMSGINQSLLFVLMTIVLSGLFQALNILNLKNHY